MIKEINDKVGLISATELNKAISPILLKASADVAKMYGKSFIKMFEEKNHFRMFLGLVVHEFENILQYQDDPQISEWVDKRKLDERKSKLLKRVLVMIKEIKK